MKNKKFYEKRKEKLLRDRYKTPPKKSAHPLTQQEKTALIIIAVIICYHFFG